MPGCAYESGHTGVDRVDRHLLLLQPYLLDEWLRVLPVQRPALFYTDGYLHNCFRSCCVSPALHYLMPPGIRLQNLYAYRISYLLRTGFGQCAWFEPQNSQACGWLPAEG